ncbi:PLP-dependent transferase, partial [Paenibacillus xylanexedens]|uniref:PLP-dependent transferase n=1 Tax=Paenibacillus xylanexedens TaxID=528191 RepID=UPI0034D985F0
MSPQVPFLHNSIPPLFSPTHSYQFIKPIKTLPLPIHPHHHNPLTIPKYFLHHPPVLQLYHPALSHHPPYQIHNKQSTP